MPFSGGGSGALQNHVHNSVPLQGGPLDFSNNTIASLSAGSTTYSNGAALQELVIGAPNDELRVSAGNIPEWYTPSAGASTWTKLYDSGQLGAAGDLDSGVFAAHDFLMIFFSGGTNTAGWGCGLKFNNTIAGSLLYRWTNTQTQAAATVYSNNTSGFLWDFVGAGGSTDWQQSTLVVSNYPTDRKTATWNTIQTKGGAIPYSNSGAGWYDNTATAITRVEMCDGDAGTSGATRQFKAGSQLIVLGLT